MQVEIVRRTPELAKGLSYYVTLFMRGYITLLPLRKEDILRLLTFRDPLSVDIDVSGLVGIVGEAVEPYLSEFVGVFREVKKSMIRLLERRFGRCNCSVKVLFIPVFHPSAKSKHHMIDATNSLVFLFPTGSTRHLLSVLGHELAHAVIRRNPEATKVIGYNSTMEEAVISFFWPGIDAASLGLSPFSLEMIEKTYVHLYKDPEVVKLLGKLLPRLLDYAKRGGGTVWEFLTV